MDLSLEQISNRLHHWNIQVRISLSGKKYKGIRMKKQEDYLWISQKSYDCYVNGLNQDYICFKNTDSKDVFELILDIFDEYRNWEEQVILAVRTGNFEDIVKYSWDIFCNPIIFHDANMKVLAISPKLDKETKNNKYEKLVLQGIISPSVYKRLEKFYQKQDTDPNFRPLYFLLDDTDPGSHILCGVIRKGGSIFGKFLVVEQGRACTTADYQNLNHICYLISEFISADVHMLDNNLIRIMQGIQVTGDEILNYYKYLGWNEGDKLRLITVEIPKQELSRPMFMLLFSYTKDLFHGSPCFVLDERILVLINEDLFPFSEILDRIKNSYLYKEESRFGISLQFKKIREMREYIRQCEFALKRQKDHKIAYFFYSAADYILASGSMREKLCACIPEIRELHAERKVDPVELYKTLKTFLLQGTNLSQTAEQLKIHKNTLVYRISKFTKTFSMDLNDPYIKEYMQMSVRILEQSSSDTELPENNAKGGCGSYETVSANDCRSIGRI